MGQHPSKRRSYTPGQDVNTEIPSTPSANGDVKSDVTLNGGIVEHRAKTNLTSHTSVASSTTSTGKKEKRRKLRFTGFPIRRTPSGRWTRKRRSVKANGASARPLSCPVTSLTEEVETSTTRPQSLFLEEFEVHEEDEGGKVETVDLSDHEDGKTKEDIEEAAPVAKPREKKAKGGSSKKSDGKKKKKEKKKDSKKDKERGNKGKKAGEETSSVEKAQDEKNEAVDEKEIASSVAPNTQATATAVDISKSEQAKEEQDLTAVAASIVEETVNNARQKLMAEQTTSTEVSESKEPQVENDTGSSHATSCSIPAVETEVKEVNEIVETSVSVWATESAPLSAKDNEDPVIVEEEIVPMKAPEKTHTVPTFLLREEEAENKKEDETNQETEKKEANEDDANLALKEVANEDVAIVEKAEAEVEDLVTTSTSSSVSVAPKNSGDEQTEVVEEAIIVQKVDKVKTVPDVDFEIHMEASSNDTEMSKGDDNKDDNSVTQEKQHNSADLSPNLTVNADTDNKVNVEDVKEKVETIFENENEENNISSAAVDAIDGNVAVAAEVVVQDVVNDPISQTAVEKGSNDDDKTQEISDTLILSTQTKDETCKDLENAPTDLEIDTAAKATAIKEQKEQERTEKLRLKKQKEEEKMKEKERVREQKRKKAEEKAVGKEKTKGDRKSLPQRISSWFKKEKPKSGATSSTSDCTIANEEAPSSPTEESAPNSPVPAAESSSSSPLVQETLTVDVSVQPMAGSEVQAKSSLSSSFVADTNSPDDSVPISPTSEGESSLHSDSSAPVSPSPEDADKGGPPGALKKINLGPRLRTAILRKKSSSASESGQEDKRVSLTQPKSVETSEMTPPPRKLRPRKPTEQYTPVTKGAHNPPKSQSPQLDTRENNEPAAVEEEAEVVDKTVSLSHDAKEVILTSDITEVVASSNSQSPVLDSQESSTKPSEEAIAVDERMSSSLNTKAVVSVEEILKTIDEDPSSSHHTKEVIKTEDDVETVALSISQSSQANAIENSRSLTEEEPKTEEKDDSNAKEVTNEVDISEAVTSSMTEEIIVNKVEPVVSTLAEKVAGDGNCETLSTADNDDHVQSVSIPNVPSSVEGATNKDCVNEEIIQVSQTTSVECHLPEESKSQSHDEAEETFENEQSQQLSQAEVNRPALNLNVNSGAIEDTVGSGEPQTEANVVVHDIDSPSLVSTASIVFKMVNGDDFTSENSTSQADEPSGVDASSTELPKAGSETSDSIQVVESKTVSESVQTKIISEISESNQVIESTESQSSPEGATSDTITSRDPGTSSSLVVSEILEEIVESSSSSTESPDSQKPDEEAGDVTITGRADVNDDDDGNIPVKFSAVCSAQIKEDTEVLSDGRGEFEEKPDTETSFITFPSNGVDHVTNGQWTEKELDIQLDDSAIEMDKESPLADTTESRPVDNNKEDDGVGSGSDNSSDCNDGGKSGPNATIDAYLKLQRVEMETTAHQGSEVNGSVSPDLTST